VAVVAQILAGQSVYWLLSPILAVVDVRAVITDFAVLVAVHLLVVVHYCLIDGLLDAVCTVTWSPVARSVLLVVGLFFMLVVASV